jgi:hypothetical protein
MERLPVPTHYLVGPANHLGVESAAGVAAMYLDLAEALRHGKALETDFAFAVRWQRFIEAIGRASDEGVRVDAF